MFALRPGRFFRSSSNKIDFVLVVAAIVAQIMTVIIIFEHKSFWRCWASLPLLRLFILTPSLRKTMTECRLAIVALMPGFAVPCLLFYLGAIGGMQLFHGKVHTESGYPVRLCTPLGSVCVTANVPNSHASPRRVSSTRLTTSVQRCKLCSKCCLAAGRALFLDLQAVLALTVRSTGTSVMQSMAL